jgi:hypothetical protein
MIIYTSPLAKWPGSVSLPDYDDFTGTHWDIWRKAFEASPDTTLNRRYAYAGLTMLESIGGEWEMEISLKDVQAWASNPGEERVRLVSWLGKQFATYIDELIDPKG